MKGEPRPGVRLIGGAVLLAIALSGCATGPQPPAAETTSSVRSVADADGAETAAPEPAPRLSDVAPGTIIASGVFEGRGATGSIEITANGSAHGFDVALTGVAPLPPEGSTLELSSLPKTASDDELRSGFSYYRYEKLAAVPDQAFSSPPPGYGGFESNDPTYMRTAVIWAALPGMSTGFGSVLATASLTWNLPHMSMDLEVIDHGSTTGARGEASLADDGTPVSYRVAAGDTAIGITARFGVTEGELEWLNPDRLPGRLLLEDITLNLSPESRGLRW